MSVHQLTRIALMACIMQVVFGSFSSILYLECITLTVVVFAMTFPTQEAVLASLVFGLMNMVLRQGITPWSIMYLLVYSIYSLLIGLLKKKLQDHLILTSLLCGFLAFLTGQLLEVPFLFVSKNITILYLMMGLKVSLVQGGMAFVQCLLLYKILHQTLKKIIN